MEIRHYNENGGEINILFDGSFYAVLYGSFGMVAHTTKIERNSDYTTCDLYFVIPDLLPISKQRLEREINKMEKRFLSDKKVNYHYEIESNKYTGYTTLQKSYIKLEIKER